MLSELLRARSAGLTLRIGTSLGRTGLSPNFFTLVGFVAVVANAALIAYGYLQLAGVLLIFSLLLDALDGAVARATNQSSTFGAFLDSTLDRWAEVIIFFGISIEVQRSGSLLDWVFVYWAICGSLLVSYTRARAQSIGIECKEGLFTRFERVVVIIAGLILLQLSIANAIIALLATFTAAQRLWYVWKTSQASQHAPK